MPENAAFFYFNPLGSLTSGEKSGLALPSALQEQVSFPEFDPAGTVFPNGKRSRTLRGQEKGRRN
jgi:hypothetical protein